MFKDGKLFGHMQAYLNFEFYYCFSNFQFWTRNDVLAFGHLHKKFGT